MKIRTCVVLFIAVGVLSWIWALSLWWIFSEEGGTIRFVAAGVYAIVAMSRWDSNASAKCSKTFATALHVKCCSQHFR